MDMFKAFAVDETRLSGGVWHVIDVNADYPVEASEIGDKCAVLVASMDSPKYRQAVERRMKPHMIRRGSQVDPLVRDTITMEAMAETIILDWKNFEIGGVVVPYSAAKCVEFLTQPKWVRLRERLMNVIGDTDAFKVQQEADIVKNS